MRVFDAALKDKIVKIINENNYPLTYELFCGDQAIFVRPLGDIRYDFTEFDEKTLALDEKFEEPEMVCLGEYTAPEATMLHQEIPADMLEEFSTKRFGTRGTEVTKLPEGTPLPTTEEILTGEMDSDRTAPAWVFQQRSKNG